MRQYDNWIRAYLEYTKYLEAPDSFHFWAGVSAIAGALRGKVFFDMGYFKWKPNFFIISALMVSLYRFLKRGT